MFCVGEKICYPMHGIGEIEGIEERTVLGITAQYYLLRFTKGRMSAMVPVESAGRIGLRRLISKEECDKVIAYMRTEPEAETENWNRRYRENCEKLRRGDIYAVADVVKCLSRRDEKRGLSAGERKMLVTARRLLSEELSEVSGIDAGELMLSL